jgi:outer membrane protein
MNTLVIVAALAALGSDTDADTSALVKVSMADAVRLALGSSELAQTSELDVERARAQLMQARAMALPQLTATLGFSRYSNFGGQLPADVADAFSYAGGGAGFPSVTNAYTANLTLSQLVYNGGQVSAALRAAAVFEQQSLRGHALSRVSVAYAARLTYASVLAQKAMLDVAAESVDLAARHLRDTRARRTAGFLTEFEELQASVQLQNAEAARIRARAALRTARDSMLRLLGLDLGREIELTDSLEALAAEGSVSTLRSYLDAAGEKRLEIEITQMASELSGLAYQVSAAGMRPTLAIQAGYVGTSGLEYWHEDFTYDWTLGAQLRIPIFDGLAASGKRRQARAEFEQAKIRLESLRRDVEREVRSAYWRFETAREYVASQVRNVSEAVYAEKLAEDRFRQGLVTSIAKEQARLGLVQAKTNLAQARFELFSSMLELQRAAGLLAAPEGDARPAAPQPGE